MESKEERNELKALREEVRKLKSALADAYLDLRLGEAYLEIACESGGIEDVDSFKKKAGAELCKGRLTGHPRKGAL